MRRLKPMQVILYDGQLWVVITAHRQDDQGRQVVNLAGYKRKGSLHSIPAYKCRVVYDEMERDCTELAPGLFIYPDKEPTQ